MLEMGWLGWITLKSLGENTVIKYIIHWARYFNFHFVIHSLYYICIILLYLLQCINKELSTPLIHWVVVEQRSHRIVGLHKKVHWWTRQCYVIYSPSLYTFIRCFRKTMSFTLVKLWYNSARRIPAFVVIAARMHPASIPKYIRSPNCIYWQQNWISIWKSLKDTGNENF